MEAEKDPDAVHNHREDQRAHIRFVKLQRTSYKTRCLEAIREPQQYLSLIIDAADQSDHGLPHTCTKSKSSDQAWKLKLHLMGVIAHGHGAYVYTCPHNFAQGHNVTIQAVFDTLIQLKRDNGWAKLPEVLYLQLDNTTKQCKGKYLLGFLALLVEAGSFRKIIVSFLPVGHTHEDIDQYFSRIALALRRHDAHSRPMLAEVIMRTRVSSSAWGAVRSVVHWENVANISMWLEDKVLDMNDVTMFHQFKLVRCGVSNRVVLLAREWPASTNPKDLWGGMNKNHTHQPLWKEDEVPNLLLDYDSVPRGKLPKNENGTQSTLSLQQEEKTRADVETLLRLLGASSACKEDTMKLVDLSFTPATVFKFNWDREHIRALLGDENRGLAASLDGENGGNEEDADIWKATMNCQVSENEFYLVQPPKGSEEPFWIVKVKKRVIVDGTPSVHVQFWEPMTEMSKERSQRDYYRCKYGCASHNPPNKAWRDLQVLEIAEGFTIPLAMELSAKSGLATIVAGRKDAKLEEIRWYVESWKENSHMRQEDDEMTPAQLVPDGRIDKPAQKKRKRRVKTTSAKPTAKPAEKPAATEARTAKPAAKPAATDARKSKKQKKQ